MTEMSVRQWQEAFRAGLFDDTSIDTQCKAGWYDWFCSDKALAGRLKKIGRVVMGITEPFILDNYYVWFKNNCPMTGPLYDDVRFDPLSGTRDGKYFLVTLDCPREEKKWSLFTERFSFRTPEFACDNARQMAQYINSIVPELEQGIQPSFLAEKRAVERYLARYEGLSDTAIRREGDHCYSYFKGTENRRIKSVIMAVKKEELPPGYDVKCAEEIGGIYIFRETGTYRGISRAASPHSGKTAKREGRER